MEPTNVTTADREDRHESVHSVALSIVFNDYLAPDSLLQALASSEPPLLEEKHPLSNI